MMANAPPAPWRPDRVGGRPARLPDQAILAEVLVIKFPGQSILDPLTVGGPIAGHVTELLARNGVMIDATYQPSFTEVDDWRAVARESGTSAVFLFVAVHHPDSPAGTEPGWAVSRVWFLVVPAHPSLWTRLRHPRMPWFGALCPLREGKSRTLDGIQDQDPAVAAIEAIDACTERFFERGR